MASVFFTLSCNGQQQPEEKEWVVSLLTTEGTIKVKLFNDTPLHRDNFLKNVKEGVYNGVAFHRVIRNFMIQAGDPYTKEGVEPEDTSAVQPTIAAEIRYPAHFHVKGALAAAREGDDVNPQKASSQWQFYIVTGKTCSEQTLSELESAKYERRVEEVNDSLLMANREEGEKVRTLRDKAKWSSWVDSVYGEATTLVAANPPVKMPKNVRKAYGIHGGAPHLDGDYTVFGEVVEGMNVVMKIEKAKTDAADRPLHDIRILQAKVE